MDLTPDEVAHCRLLAELEVGLVEPEVVEVFDGYYTQRAVLDESIEASFQLGQMTPLQALEHRLEPCRIPRFRKEIRYRRA